MQFLGTSQQKRQTLSYTHKEKTETKGFKLPIHRNDGFTSQTLQGWKESAGHKQPCTGNIYCLRRRGQWLPCEGEGQGSMKQAFLNNLLEDNLLTHMSLKVPKQ